MTLVQIEKSSATYRAEGLAVRNLQTGEFERFDPTSFSSIEAVPEFADRWAMSAAGI